MRGVGVLCAAVCPAHWFWDPHCPGAPSRPALPCCSSDRAPPGSQAGPARGLKPPHTRVSGPGASEADAGDGLRSCAAPGRSGTGRGCMEGGLGTGRGRGWRWLTPRRTAGGSWGPAGGRGASCPTGVRSRGLGRGSSLCSSLGDSRPGPPPSSRRPLACPPWCLQGQRTHHHSGISWGRSWYHPEGLARGPYPPQGPAQR